MYDTILVATDGSADTNRAATHALELAPHSDGELRRARIYLDRHDR